MKLLLVVLFVGCVTCITVPEEKFCFDGKSYILYDPGERHISSTKDIIKFKFRSSDASGLLLYARARGLSGDHVLVELVSGKLRVRYQLGQNSSMKEDILGDGLGDDIISTVTILRDKKKVTVSAHGGQSDKLDFTIPGADDRLDLSGYIFVGGYSNPTSQYPSTYRVNFTGCMFRASFNDIDFLLGMKENKNGFKGVKLTRTQVVPSRAMNFNRQTFIRMAIQRSDPTDPTKILQKLYGSFEFRTILNEGTIFRASSVSLNFQKSQLNLKSGGDIVAIDFPDEGQANDGRWFKVSYVAENYHLELELNGVKKFIRPANFPQYGHKINFGYLNNEAGFVGCIRNLVVQGVVVDYHKIIFPYTQNRIAEYAELTEGCKASDPCVPNPCFHDAECFALATEERLRCDCRNSYELPLCQFSLYKSSCSAKKKYEPGTIGPNKGEYYIDPDDSGPESPVQVYCNFDLHGGIGVSEIGTKGAENVLITPPSAYSERFSYKKEIKYNIPIASVKAIVDRSETCEQLVIYDCKDAPLFNQPGGDPASRWLSANGYLQYYWGGASPNSYKCACAYSEVGCDGGAFCNCDARAAEGKPRKDEGVLNITRDLPVREVQFGGLSKTSQAFYSIRKIMCYGTDTLGVVTFVARDGWLRAPPWNAPLGGDISFYIKTVFASGDLIDHRNSDESHNFQVRIHNDRTIQVVISFGSSIKMKYYAMMRESLGRLNDNRWHRIHIIRTLFKLEVRIDDQPTLDPKTNSTNNPLLLSGDGKSRLDIDLPMFVGSFWRYPTYMEGYIGCMKGFTINGVLFDLANAVDNLAMEPEALVLKGCGNACKTNRCPYGKCVEKYTSYECDCTDTPFYGTFCTEEIGASIQTSPIYANLSQILSKSEKMVLAFSVNPSRCRGTLFEVLSEDKTQFYKLTLESATRLTFQLKLVSRLTTLVVPIDVTNMDLCDTTRHIVYIERNSSAWVKYRIDGRAMGKIESKQQASGLFKPHDFYVGNNHQGNKRFDGCMSGVKFHLVSSSNNQIKTVEPIRQGVRTNDTVSGNEVQSCGPTIKTPMTMIRRIIPYPTTPTDYPSTEFLRDVGLHAAEDTNWAVLIVVALLLMLVLVAVVVLTVWFVMRHKNDYQILEKEDGTVLGTATVRVGAASVASVPAAASGYTAAARAPPSHSSQSNLSRAKSKSNDLFV